MCKTSLQADGTSNWGVNEFVEQSIKRLFPLDLLERQNGFEEDQMNEANVPSEIRSKAVYHRHPVDSNDEFAVFVCTTSFPKIPCPLHVSEPRHRLMIR